MKRLGMIVAVAVVGGVIGCTTMTPQQQGTVTGAAIGAAAGAGIAAIAGGSGWTGAAIGGVVGAATGASAGAAIAAFMPGVGPVVAAGWAAMALLGLAGAVGGGVAGNAIEDALSSGVPKDELFLYEDALRKGHTVVIALSDDTILIDAARKVMREEDAEDLDTARERWWIGVRPEDEEYREPAYRHGVEAALHPDARGKTWQEAEPFLAKRHGDIFRDEVFRRGYDRGRAHHERWRETHRQ